MSARHGVDICDAYGIECQCGRLFDGFPTYNAHVLAALDEREAEAKGLRAALADLVDSAVLVPMEREDDDDGPSEFWCVHPDPLDAARAALADTPEPTP